MRGGLAPKRGKYRQYTNGGATAAIGKCVDECLPQLRGCLRSVEGGEQRDPDALQRDDIIGDLRLLEEFVEMHPRRRTNGRKLIVGEDR